MLLLAVLLQHLFSAWLLQNLNMAHGLLAVAGVIVAGFFIREIITLKGQERANLIACLILIIQAIFFFTLYQQMPTSLNLFAVRNVEHSLLGFDIPPATFQALNPLWIIIASPILAYFYSILGAKGKDLSMPTKFTIGMFLCSMGFFVSNLFFLFC